MISKRVYGYFEEYWTINGKRLYTLDEVKKYIINYLDSFTDYDYDTIRAECNKIISDNMYDNTEVYILGKTFYIEYYNSDDEIYDESYNRFRVVNECNDSYRSRNFRNKLHKSINENCEYWGIDEYDEIYGVTGDEQEIRKYILDNVGLDEYDIWLDNKYGDGYAENLLNSDEVAYYDEYHDFEKYIKYDVVFPCSYDGECINICGFDVTYNCNNEDEYEGYYIDYCNSDDEYDESYNRNRRRTRSMPVEARNRRRRRF